MRATVGEMNMNTEELCAVSISCHPPRERMRLRSATETQLLWHLNEMVRTSQRTLRGVGYGANDSKQCVEQSQQEHASQVADTHLLIGTLPLEARREAVRTPPSYESARKQHQHPCSHNATDSSRRKTRPSGGGAAHQNTVNLLHVLHASLRRVNFIVACSSLEPRPFHQ